MRLSKTLNTVNRNLQSTSLVTAFMISLLLSLMPQSNAESIKPTSKASFDKQVIDLSKSWGGAKACTVWGPNEVHCYASYKEDLAAEFRRGNPKLTQSQALEMATAIEMVTPQASSHNCPNGFFDYKWVCLYEHSNWDGRRLRFRQAGFWQYLSTYGFHNQTSSWADTLSHRGFDLWDFNGGRRLVLSPGSSSVMPPNWNDAADVIYIYP